MFGFTIPLLPMNRLLKPLVSLGLLLTFCCTALYAQQVKYISGNNSWNADSLGNHRAVVNVTTAGPAAKVTIAWRRRDEPIDKQVLVVDAKSNKQIPNVKTENLSRESGTVYFEPTSGPGKYYIYYMPYQVKAKSNYPQAIYNKPVNTASAAWLAKTANPVNATLLYLEAVNAMNSFYPMEIIATGQEVQNLIKANPAKEYLVFTEDRNHPTKMQHDLSQRWIQKGAPLKFTDAALKGENFSYQLGLYPVTRDLQNVQLSFSDLKDAAGHRIPATVMSCLNTDGTKYDGSPLSNTVNVSKGDVQALWCLVNIPAKTVAGSYNGTVIVKAANAAPTTVKISITIKNQTAINGGVNEPQKQTRLTWLNSTLAQKNEVIKPYTPLKVDSNTISLLGRRVILNKTGFPDQLQTFFNQEMTDITTTPKNILGENIHFHIVNAATHKDIAFKSAGLTFTEKTPGTVKWTATNTSEFLKLDITGSLEFDGYMNYTVKMTALSDVNLDDVKFHIPFDKGASKYLMGLNQKGGLRPDTLNWKWDVAKKNQDGAWIGEVNAGLQYSLRDEHYVRPLNTNFYLQKPLLLPTSWGNEGKGGITIKRKGKNVLVDNYSGPRTMKKGDVLYYNFTLLITPFHTINTDFQWSTRFYHKYNNPDSIKATGATVVNIHHATPINPTINYPFIAHDAMKHYITQAHHKRFEGKNLQHRARVEQ
jgi:hypothetical protein